MSDFLPFEQTGLAQAVEGGALAGVTQEEQGIFVPEAQEEVEFSDDATGIDLDSLIGLYLEVGQEGLTEEEFLIIEPLLIERERKSAASENHNANLAEHVDDSELTKIAQDVLQWVQWDQQSREAWYKQEKAGIEALGVLPDDNVKANFDGGSKVIHPVIAEASVQFQARAMDSLWPAGGPVDTAVLGQANKEKQQQAKRVEKYMNYQYTTGIQGAYDQFDKMMIMLPLSGSCFSKVYFDHNLKQVTRKHIEPAYFLVPYKADDLRTAPRYTEIIKTSTNDVRKLQVAGYYSDVNLLQPSDNHEGGQYDEGVDERIRETEGRNDGGYFRKTTTEQFTKPFAI